MRQKRQKKQRQIKKRKKKEKKKIKKKKIGPKLKTEAQDIKNNVQSIQVGPGRNEVFSGIKLSTKPHFLESNKNISPRRTQDEYMIPQQPQFNKIKFSYNIFEIFISTFLCCCMSRRLRIKKNTTEKANNILYNKLDIVLFMRNMILLDIMSKLLVNNNSKNGIIKFLSRPIVSEDKIEESKLNESTKIYRENDFDNFYYEIWELVKKAEKKETEKQLLSLSNMQLKELVYK